MQKDLEEMIENKFSLLESVKEIKCGNKYSATLSIGIGFNSQSLKDKSDFARSAVTLALGRGCDQAITKDNDNMVYYGGKSREHEKTTKVKARVTTLALKELFQHASNIIIMGHKYIDADAFGAAVGVRAIAHSMGKDAKIVCDSRNPQINQLVKRISENVDYEDVIIEKEEALSIVDKSTVVVVVDTHRPAYTEVPELLECENIILIDHHRRGVEFINDTVLLFHETYVSSTCEMVTELVQYMEDNVKINKITAEGLLAGINLDTKNFAFKTGVRTFEAASYLKKSGADTIEVKKMFNSDINDFITKADIIQSTKIINDNICLAYTGKEADNINIVVAQAADELLNIKQVEASFVLGQKNGRVFVSARSLGNINVHVLMEKLGGGGHRDIAGAQFKDITIEEAYNKVKEVIQSYLKEEE
jgi:c-di-AMP phosphodiesterase-like protein